MVLTSRQLSFSTLDGFGFGGIVGGERFDADDVVFRLGEAE